MKNNLIISPTDNVAVALSNISKGDKISIKEKVIIITEDIPIKHKFTLQALNVNDVVTMYGVPVGIATKPIAEGALIHANNIKHNAAPYKYRQANYKYEKPFTNGLAEKTFLGYHRNDGRLVLQITGFLYLWYFAKIEI